MGTLCTHRKRTHTHMASKCSAARDVPSTSQRTAACYQRDIALVPGELARSRRMMQCQKRAVLFNARHESAQQQNRVPLYSAKKRAWHDTSHDMWSRAHFQNNWDACPACECTPIWSSYIFHSCNTQQRMNVNIHPSSPKK